MDNLITNIMPYLENLNQIWYLIILSVSFIESFIITGYFMPWSVIIIIFWMLAWWWYYDIWDVIFFSTLWNALWGLFSFYIWKKIWKKVLKEWFYFIKAKHFLKADYFFIKHWWKSILFWKIIPWIKENISFISWVLKVWIFKFIIYNTLGWLLWSLIFVWIWYVFSSSLSLAEMWGTRFWYIILITLLLFSLIWYWVLMSEEGIMKWLKKLVYIGILSI